MNIERIFTSTAAVRTFRSAVWGILVAAVIVSTAATASAQRTEYLVRTLQRSETFRVRVQAAISLGRIEASPATVAALSRALGDDHPAVRTAAASSLERLADPSALAALQRLRRDRDRSVRRAVTSAIRSLERVARSAPRETETPTRFYVGIGEPGNLAGVNQRTLSRTQGFLRTEVQGIAGVVVAPAGENNRAARRVLRRRRLTGFYLDISIVSVEVTSAGTRAVVSVIVNTYPGRDMRAILNGGATVPGATSPAAERAAIEGAIRGALRRLPQAMEASAG